MSAISRLARNKSKLAFHPRRGRGSWYSTRWSPGFSAITRRSPPFEENKITPTFNPTLGGPPPGKILEDSADKGKVGKTPRPSPPPVTRGGEDRIRPKC